MASKKVKTVIILTFSALNSTHFEQFSVFLLEIHINPDFWGHVIGIRGGATAPCLGKLFRIRQFSAVFGVAEGTHIIKMFKKPSETVF